MTITEIEDRYVDLIEAARMLRIHPQSLRRLVKDGTGPRARLFAGKYLILRDDLELFRASGYSGKPGRKPGRRLL